MEPSLGDKIYEILLNTRVTIFKQGELYQLANSAFHFTSQAVPQSNPEPIELQYPLGVSASGETIFGKAKYTKDEFIRHHQAMSEIALPYTGIIGLVTTIESLFGNLFRAIILKYPQKLGKKQKVSLSSVLRFDKIENIHNAVIDEILNELFYKSPKDFAEEVSPTFGFSMLQIPEFHKYIEIKATRDIMVHNNGTANDIYLHKTGSHARAKSGDNLPLNHNYFLNSYEVCIKLIEELEMQFHEIWPSELYLKRNEDKKI